MEASRFDAKLIQSMVGQPMILWMLDRASRIDADTLTVAMPDTEGSRTVLGPLVERHGHHAFIYEGDPNDVLKRYVAAIRALDIGHDDIVIRLTGDCPLIDPDLIDSVITFFKESQYDYIALAKEWPDGLDVEVMFSWLLTQADRESKKKYEGEHVTPWIWNNPKISMFEWECPFDLSSHRWSVDTKEDFLHIEDLMRYTLMQYGPYFDWFHVYCTLMKFPESILSHVTSIPRNASFVHQYANEEGIDNPPDWNTIRYGKEEKI